MLLNSKGFILCGPLCPWPPVFCRVSRVFGPETQFFVPPVSKQWNKLMMSWADVNVDPKDTGRAPVSGGRVPATQRCPPCFSPQWRAPLCNLPFLPSVSFSRTMTTQTVRHPPQPAAERFCLLSPYSAHLPPPVGPVSSPLHLPSPAFLL